MNLLGLTINTVSAGTVVYDEASGRSEAVAEGHAVIRGRDIFMTPTALAEICAWRDRNATGGAGQ